MEPTIILSIETSCDETAAAVVQYDENGLFMLSSIVSSQIELHAKYGGVVPNLAAREHVQNIIPVIEKALEIARVDKDAIDAIAVTQGPGLIPALLIGVSAAKTLALVWQKPLLGIHHIEGHIYASFIGNDQSPKSNDQNAVFPLLALVVSGGHTQLVLMKDHFEYGILGETRDDAAGEAFDKVARILGLPYPGGPAIAAKAANYESKGKSVIPAKAGIQVPQISLDPRVKPEDDKNIVLPRPMIDSPDLDFSFSGLKTAVLYLVKENEARKTDDAFINEVAHEFQNAVVDVLVTKTAKAIKAHSPKTVIIAGGVSANEELRNRLRNSVETDFPETTFMMPEFKYSLDNAAMIGAAAAVRFACLSSDEHERLKSNAISLDPNANLAL